MSIWGATELDWVRPVQPVHEDPHQRTEIGAHRQATAALNVRNPQPGRHYFWANADNANSIRRAQVRGFQFVTRDEPEGEGYDDFLPPDRTRNQDQFIRFNGLVLMWCPIDVIRQRREERVRANMERMHQPTRDWHDWGRQVDDGLGGRASRKGSYYEGPDHGIEILEAGVQPRR